MGKVQIQNQGKKPVWLDVLIVQIGQIWARVFRELSTAEKSTLKITYFCQCPSLWFSNWAKTKFSFKFQPVCMGQMLESSDFEQPATDPSIISIESSTKNLEEPKGLEKTLKMQLFVNALAFGGLILSKSDFWGLMSQDFSFGSKQKSCQMMAEKKSKEENSVF